MSFMRTFLDQERRAECQRNDVKLAEWMREWSAKPRAVTPALPILARGNHRVAQNDEPEVA